MTSRYDDPEYQKQVANQMLATPTLEIACRAITDLRQELGQERVYIGDLLRRIAVLQKDSNELQTMKTEFMNVIMGRNR
jgi:hypothetical protein